MSTRAQRRAARRNGKKSRGPVTPEGKARSAANSLRHGLTSPDRAAHGVRLHNEDPAEFNLLHDTLIAEYLPATPTESLIVHEMAAARWLLNRSWLMASALLDNKVDAMRPQLDQDYESTDEATRAALAFDELAAARPSLALLNRYQTSHSRQFDRCVRRLNSLRTTRNNEFPNEPSPSEEAPNDHQFPESQSAGAAQSAEPKPEQREPAVIRRETTPGVHEFHLSSGPTDLEPPSGAPPGLPRAA